MSQMTKRPFYFQVTSKLANTLARTGVIHTPHGDIKTPAFIVVGTKADVKAMVPEMVRDVGAQAVLANAYHLYLQPGHELIAKAGGLSKFMNWNGPTFTDSGGFQVLSLGSGFKKVLAMTTDVDAELAIAKKGDRHAWVTDDGVKFKSHLDGSYHFFTPEFSMQIQHGIGSDVAMAFDELTSLADGRKYQEESLARTHRWAERSLAEMKRLNTSTPDYYQALFGVLQGANYEDLRKETATWMAERDFDGYGIGGALEKEEMGTIIRWCNEILPEDRPRHLLGISEPDDIFAAIEQGIDTFDCVSPTRVARNGSAYTPHGRINIRGKKYIEAFAPIFDGCDCYTCQHYTLAYLNHLTRAKETLSGTLISIHNERFIIKLVDDIRESIEDGTFYEFRDRFLGEYYSNKS
jgi:queuine tRNA-ribosyltransferase